MNHEPGSMPDFNGLPEFPLGFFVDRYTSTDRLPPDESDSGGRDIFRNPLSKLVEHVRTRGVADPSEFVPDSESKYLSLEAELSRLDRKYQDQLTADERPDRLIEGLGWRMEVCQGMERDLAQLLWDEYHTLERNPTPQKAQHTFHALENSALLMEFLGYEQVKPIALALWHLALKIIREAEQAESASEDEESYQQIQEDRSDDDSGDQRVSA